MRSSQGEAPDVLSSQQIDDLDELEGVDAEQDDRNDGEWYTVGDEDRERKNGSEAGDDQGIENDHEMNGTSERADDDKEDPQEERDYQEE